MTMAKGSADESARRQTTFDTFSGMLDAVGVRDALVYLLELSEYRFIGIFRLENAKARAVIHYDRENPHVMFVDEVPDAATYCCFVQNSNNVFSTADALGDARLLDHPARKVIRSYCGIPVMDPDGVILGTLCHYDLVPRDPDKLDLQLLLQAAVRLSQGNYLPAYTSAPGR